MNDFHSFEFFQVPNRVRLQPSVKDLSVLALQRSHNALQFHPARTRRNRPPNATTGRVKFAKGSIPDVEQDRCSILEMCCPDVC
jgi:hypothetical protein